MTRRPRSSALHWLLAAAFLGPPAIAADVVVVCPDGFRTALQPWVNHRNDEGLEIRILGSEPEAATLRQSIAQAADTRTRYVMLVGDAPVIGTPCQCERQIPILYSPTTVTAAWGSTKSLSSDMRYGDTDGDGSPDAVVGRLPVDTPEQLERLVRRIMARDNSGDFGPWRSQVQLVGGVGGFGPMIDSAIESVTRAIVTGVLPPDTKTNVCYASPGHAFFPSGKPFTQAVLDQYQKGSRFWVYAGHGQVTHLDRVPNTVSGRPVLDPQTVPLLRRPAGSSPIALMLACYTGAMDAAEDSIAERMVLCDGGPIAVLAGSRVTMPYGNTTAAVGLIDGVFSKKLPRLGDAWRNALEQMHQNTTGDTSSTRVMIDALATMVSPAGTQLVDERREHMLLYNLIGDPTLRLHHPLDLPLQVETGYDFGQPIDVEIDSPIAGNLTVAVDRPLTSTAGGDPNDTTVTSVTLPVAAGQTVRPSLRLPEDSTGPFIVRARVEGDSGWASSAARMLVRPKS